MFNDVVNHVLQKRISKDMVKFLKRIEGKGDEDVHDEIFPKYMGKWCNIDGVPSMLPRVPGLLLYVLRRVESPRTEHSILTYDFH